MSDADAVLPISGTGIAPAGTVPAEPRTANDARAASGRQIATGAAWLMLFKLVDRSIGLVSTLILARLLAPADFGLVAMAMAVVAFTQLMGAFGFDSALIQRQDAQREHYDTAWTFNVLFGLAVAVLLLLLAWPMAGFYRDDRLIAITLVLAAGAAAGGFENIGTVAFRKELDFRSEFRFLFVKRIASFAVTVGLALWLRSYWALVAGTLTGRLVAVWISYRLHPYRPRLSLAARRDLMHFSKWIFLSNVIVFFTSKSTDFILGRTVGSHGLGIFNVSWEIAIMPSGELIAPINRAVFPAYSRLASDPPSLQSRFIEVFGVICFFAIPVSGGLFAAADAFVRVVLGPQWLESIALIRLFALCGLIGALQSNLYLLIVAMGKPRANTLLSAWLLLFSLPVIVWASLNHGVLGASYALLAYTVAGIVGILWIFGRVTRIRLAALRAVFWRPVVASALMVAGMWWLDGRLLEAAGWIASPLVRLTVLCVSGGATYLVLIGMLWGLCGHPPGAERLAFEFLRSLPARLASPSRRREHAAAIQPADRNR